LEQDSSTQFIGGCDPGYRDPTAFLVVAYLPDLQDAGNDKFWVVEEYEESEQTTAYHAEQIRNFAEHYKVELIFIDSAAAQFAQDLAYQYDIPTVRAKKDVLPGIAYVQTLVDQGKLLVDPKCVKTIEALNQYKWDTREGLTREKPNHDKYSHLMDALRYCLYSFTR
jgi:phage terminase large subunit